MEGRPISSGLGKCGWRMEEDEATKARVGEGVRSLPGEVKRSTEACLARLGQVAGEGEERKHACMGRGRRVGDRG